MTPSIPFTSPFLRGLDDLIGGIAETDVSLALGFLSAELAYRNSLFDLDAGESDDRTLVDGETCLREGVNGGRDAPLPFLEKPHPLAIAIADVLKADFQAFDERAIEGSNQPDQVGKRFRVDSHLAGLLHAVADVTGEPQTVALSDALRSFEAAA